MNPNFDSEKSRFITSRYTMLFGVGVENVAHGSQTLKMDRLFGIFLKVFPETHDEVIHGPRGAIKTPAPDPVQDYFSCERSIR